jgi:hypothetical protein
MANVDNKLFEKRKKELGFGSDCTILHPSTERRRAQLTESIERLLNNTDSRKKNSIKLYAVGEDEVKIIEDFVTLQNDVRHTRESPTLWSSFTKTGEKVKKRHEVWYSERWEYYGNTRDGRYVCGEKTDLFEFTIKKEQGLKCKYMKWYDPTPITKEHMEIFVMVRSKIRGY